jgi:hypothetical protein
MSYDEDWTRGSPDHTEPNTPTALPPESTIPIDSFKASVPRNICPAATALRTALRALPRVQDIGSGAIRIFSYVRAQTRCATVGRRMVARSILRIWGTRGRPPAYASQQDKLRGLRGSASTTSTKTYMHFGKRPRETQCRQGTSARPDRAPNRRPRRHARSSPWYRCWRSCCSDCRRGCSGRGVAGRRCVAARSWRGQWPWCWCCRRSPPRRLHRRSRRP